MTRDRNREDRHELDPTLAATPSAPEDATLNTGFDAGRPSSVNIPGTPQRYRLESELGRGSMFSVVFPLRIDPERAREMKAELAFRGKMAAAR